MGVIVREDKKGSGVWYIYINHQGKRKAMMVGPKRAALKLADEIKEEDAVNGLDDPKQAARNRKPGASGTEQQVEQAS